MTSYIDSMAQTSSSDETSFKSEKEQIFLILSEFFVLDRNCKFHDTIPHIIS